MASRWSGPAAGAAALEAAVRNLQRLVALVGPTEAPELSARGSSRGLPVSP